MHTQRFLVAAAAAALVVPALAWSHPPDGADFQADRAAAFAEADANHDGALTLEEFATFTQLMEQHRAARHFQHADADGNGVVTLAELEAMRPPGPPPGRRGYR
jgi:hypothetical protein